MANFFVHTALLWFAVAAAIPLILHLLTLHRLKTVELSTYRFLFDSYVQQRRRMQFLEALLALLRFLFVLGLVFAFARPFLPQIAPMFNLGSGREVVMLIDCSASMNAAAGGMTALDRAKTSAVKEIDRMDGNRRLTLIRVGARPEELFSRYTSEKEEIRARIDELKVGPSRGNFFAALTQVFGPEAPQRGQPLVYLYTDCQSTGWREVRKQGLDRIVPSDAEFVVVNVGAPQPIPNLAVIGNSPRRQHAVVGLPIYLTPRVVNKSETQAEVTVNVLIDEKEVGRAKMNLKPNETVSQRVIYFPSETGLHRGRFEISSTASDGFPDDNRFDFTLSVVPRPKALVVNGNPSVNAQEDDGRYLMSVLRYQVEDTKGEKKPGEQREAREFARLLEVQEIQEAALNAEALKDVSVVILANCGGMNAQHFIWLREFVNNGGGLVIFPGTKVNPALYNDQFFPVPGTLGEKLTPVRLGNPEGDPEKAETFERLAAIDFTHRVMQIFNEPNKKHFSTVRFYRRFPLEMPEKAENAVTLASFANGKPALVESRFGDGVVFLAAFSASAQWSNLPTRGGANFWPLVTELVNHARHRPEVEGPSVVRADGSAEFVVSGGWNSATGTVTDPNGHNLPIEFQRSGNRLLGIFDRAATRGFYTVKIQGGRSDQPKTATLAFAVNLAPEESDTALVVEKDFSELLPGKVHFLDANVVAAQLSSLNEKREFYQLLIYLLFLVIGIEFALATLGGRKDAEGEERTVSERIRDISTGSFVARMTGAGKGHE
jgi:hypothetical protein